MDKTIIEIYKKKLELVLETLNIFVKDKEHIEGKEFRNVYKNPYDELYSIWIKFYGDVEYNEMCLDIAIKEIIPTLIVEDI